MDIDVKENYPYLVHIYNCLSIENSDVIYQGRLDSRTGKLYKTYNHMWLQDNMKSLDAI